jgi:hypothetical protein
MTALLVALGATDNEITHIFQHHGGEIPPFNKGALLTYARHCITEARTHQPAVTTSQPHQ